MKFLTQIIAAAMLIAPLRADLKTDLGLSSGDFNVIAGDSITVAQKWSNYFAVWMALNYPAEDYTTIALSSGGTSTYGWTIDEYESRVMPLDPDAVFLMLGHNDGSNVPAQKTNTESLIDQWILGGSDLNAAAVPILIGAHPTSSADGKPAIQGFSNNYETIGIAEDYAYSDTWEILSPTWIADFTNNSPALVGGADAVHPGTVGHILIAWSALKGLGVIDNENLVSSATINASTETTTASEDCTISNIDANAYGGIDFDRLDERLPWAIDEAGRADAETLIPGSTTWQDYIFAVTNLAAGTYEIYCDDELVTTATATELAAGVNLSGATQGPVWEQGQAALSAQRVVQGYNPTTLAANSPNSGAVLVMSLSTNAYNAGLTGAGLKTYMRTPGSSYNGVTNNFDRRASLITQYNAVRTAAEPVTRTWSIRSTGPLPAWSYVGIPYPDWDYDPCTIDAPTAPAEWPEAENSLYYYVEPGHPNASDTVDGSDTTFSGLRFGYPDRPRLTLPVWSNVNNNYQAGRVIWVKGGYYNRVNGTASTWAAQFAGTAEAPCWIYGEVDDRVGSPTFGEPPTMGGTRLRLFKTTHLIVDGIRWGTRSGGDSGAISIGADTLALSEEGPCNNITVRNCSVVDRQGTNGSFFSVTASKNTNFESRTDTAPCHDIMFYNNYFSNNSVGTDFDADDVDLHGHKFNGGWGSNRAYRIWVIDNEVRPGAVADSDGYKKSLAGNFVQVGDQQTNTGNVDHVYIAGNISEGTRQGCVGIKRASHIIVSSNTVLNILQTDTANGQAFNTKYDRGDDLWFLNNHVDGAISGITRAPLDNSGGTHDPSSTSVYIVGNVFENLTGGTYDSNDTSSSTGAGKTRGIAIHDQHGLVVIANNTIANSEYGLTAAFNRSAAGSMIYYYNNAGYNLGSDLVGNPGNVDPVGGRMIAVTHIGAAEWIFENNYQDDVFSAWINTTTPINLATFNGRADATGNLEGDADFVDPATSDYSVESGSPLIDAGVEETTLDPFDVYAAFVTAFDDDPDFPGDPEDVWPRDYLGLARVQGGGIDIGAYESGLAAPIEPPPGGVDITTGTLNVGTLTITAP